MRKGDLLSALLVALALSGTGCVEYQAAYHNAQGLDAYRSDELEPAVRAYRHALRLDPDFPEALNNLGLAYQRLGLLEEAEDAYRDALRADPWLGVAHLNLAALYDDRGWDAQARVAYENGLALEPEDAVARTHLAALLVRVGEPEGALDHAMVAAAQDPQRPTARFTAGEVLAALGRHREAIAYFDEVLVLAPTHREAALRRGIALTALDQLDAAEDQFRRLVQQDDGFAEAFNHLGHVRLLRGDPGEAIGHFSQAVALHPDYGTAWLNLGRAYAELGLLDLAIERTERALIAAPRDPEVHRALGDLWRRRGELARAEAAYTQALALGGDDPTLRADLQEVRASR